MRPYKKIKLPLFPVSLTFIAGYDYAKKIGLDMEDRLGGCVFYRPQGLFFVIADESQYTNNMISHESVHAAWRALDYCGVTVDVNNQEPLAYLTGHIAREAYIFYERYYGVDK